MKLSVMVGRVFALFMFYVWNWNVSRSILILFQHQRQSLNLYAKLMRYLLCKSRLKEGLPLGTKWCLWRKVVSKQSYLRNQQLYCKASAAKRYFVSYQISCFLSVLAYLLRGMASIETTTGNRKREHCHWYGIFLLIVTIQMRL